MASVPFQTERSMAASEKMPVPKGIGGTDDDVAAAGGKKACRWGFVQFFFVLAVVLCVLLYAPRELVLGPYRYSIGVGLFAPSVPLQQRVSGGGNAGGDGGHGREVVLDNQVDSPCSSMRDHTICCDRSSVHTDVCFMAGDVRTDATSLSLLLFPPHQHWHHQAPNGSWQEQEERVRPYPRKWERFIVDMVPEVRLRVAAPQRPEDQEHQCDVRVRHDAPLLVMSAGGYAGNLFHAFNDGFLPSWVTVQHFRRRVVLGVLSYNPWWASMFSEVISGLTDHDVVDLLHDNRTHCFPGAIVGTRYHGILIVDSARLRDNKTIVEFHQMLADAYEKPPPRETPPTTTTVQQDPRAAEQRQPRLGIVSRKGTRVIENQAAVARLASSVGFDVDILETADGRPLSAWYASLRACDALVGVHGADLTNFLFLRPGHASLTQIAPLGLSPIAQEDFGDPAARMGLAYEQYEVRAAESSLARLYAPDDAVVADPEKAMREQGWDLVSRVYLGGQNVTLDLARFRRTLARMHAHALRQRRRQEGRRR